MTDELWCTFTSRADLIPILLGQHASSTPMSLPFTRMGLGKDDVLLISAGREERPVIAVVDDNALRDFLVWVETYAPQFSPISQFLRVLSDKDLDFLTTVQVRPTNRRAAKAFAGVVVGELLAQSGSDPTKVLDGASLSMAQQTYSQAYARSVLLWNTSLRAREAIEHSFDVLRFFRFVPERRLELNQLTNVWELIEGLPNAQTRGVWGVIAEAARSIGSDERLSDSTIKQLVRWFEPANELFLLPRNSAEDRVLALDRILSAEIGNGSADAQVAAAFCAAYAAVEIGGGTTRHMNLLSELGESVPLVWPLFGLLASMGDSEKWHPNFARVAKFVERELLYSFNLTDAPRADIAVRELAAIAASKKSEFLPGIPRAQQRVLTVETAPGVPLNIPVGVKQAADAKGDASASVSPIDTTKLDSALAALWEFRQSVVNVAGHASSTSSPSSPKQSAGRKRSAKESKGKEGKLL